MGKLRYPGPFKESIRDHYEWAKEFSVQLAPVVVRRWEWKGEFIRHDHDFWEVQFVLDGHGTHISIDGEQKMRKGDAFIIRPGAWHEYHKCEGMTAYICCFSPRLLLNELSWTLTDPRLNRLFWWQDSGEGKGAMSLHMDDQRAWKLCEKHLFTLWHLAEDNVAATRVDRIGHLTLIFAELARCLPEDESRTGNDEDFTQKAQGHWAVREAMRILHDELTEEFSASELSQRLGIEESYLGRLFRSAVGDSPIAYLSRCRAEKAASLLLKTSLTIAEIGLNVGWPDPNHFARRFRQYYGMSASSYRQAGKPSFRPPTSP